MKLNKFCFLFYGFVWVLISLGLVGCQSYKNVAYFKDIPDSAQIALKTTAFSNLKIQKGDILNVQVMTIDPMANAIFNQSTSSIASPLGGSSAASSISSGDISINSGSMATGYRVDENGEIELPLLGAFKADGISTDSLKNVIQLKASEYYKAPAITVRFSNLRINVLGEVLRPGIYTLSNEKNTIFDALSMAGDLTIFGRRENVLLIRDSAGTSRMIRFSLNSKDLVKRDFYYLKQNDVLYIEPGRGKAASLDAASARNYAIAASILSVIIILATRVK